MKKFKVRVERKIVKLERNWVEVEAPHEQAAKVQALKEAKTFSDDRWDYFDEIDHGVMVVDIEDVL